jgi:hypothetical protein
MGPHFVGEVSESALTDALDNSTNAPEDLPGGNAEKLLLTGLHVHVDGSRRGSIRILTDPKVDGGPAADRAELGILGLVHACQ